MLNKHKSIKRDIFVFISFLILFVSIYFLVNIRKEMPPSGLRSYSIVAMVTDLWYPLTYNSKRACIECKPCSS